MAKGSKGGKPPVDDDVLYLDADQATGDESLEDILKQAQQSADQMAERQREKREAARTADATAPAPTPPPPPPPPAAAADPDPDVILEEEVVEDEPPALVEHER